MFEDCSTDDRGAVMRHRRLSCQRDSHCEHKYDDWFSVHGCTPFPDSDFEDVVLAPISIRGIARSNGSIEVRIFSGSTGLWQSACKSLTCSEFAVSIPRLKAMGMHLDGAPCVAFVQSNYRTARKLE